ncbi:MAG TPA: tetratricopeptide repeat protein [Opitutaceae bacterium]|nr:tetratricopeptide repeat protein [Opitutaceae bacterium]
MTASRKSFDGSRVFAGGGRWFFALILIGVTSAGLRAAEVPDVEREFLAGNYAKVIEAAEAGAKTSPGNEEWHLLLTRALLEVGRYRDADVAITTGTSRLPQSIRLRWAAREVALASGRPLEANTFAQDITRLFFTQPRLYRTATSIVVLGRAQLALGASPKEVLERIYAVAQKAEPKVRDVYLARGDLALEKHDFALAATVYEEGLKQLPDDPDFHYGLARAHAEGDSKTMLAAIQAALKQNPRHVPTLLLLADHRIDEENYSEAEKLLSEAIEVNPQQPDAWALRSVMAHLRSDSGTEEASRSAALRSWSENPRVDWLIGKKLSAKYRFAEGAERQRQALRFAPNYLPAKAELANNLLRLGDEAEGWKLAKLVHEEDGYDVEAFNLATLHDTMAKYATLSNDDFTLRMTGNEAAIYGPQVLDLLTRAKKQLTEKYGAQLAKPTYVEIFADPKDFAVRTFGLPDVSGFLGVCFGRVVTANSPASTAGHGTNWQSVLWHEFCHVVTLQLTENKMPRWLSEGISVYEERQASPAWGQHLTPRYRELILKGELTPVGKMSAAFLTPPTPEHLQFAYYQASLVVEFVVSRHGLPKVRALLTDLREGDDINRALARQIAPLDKVEKDFTAYAREHAEQLAPKMDFEKPGPKLLLPGAEEDLAEWTKEHPDNYWALQQKARNLIADKKWTEAKVPLLRSLELYPDQRDSDSALRQLALVHRALNETDQEREALTKFVALDAEAPDACLRLVELATAAKDWPAVAQNARRFLEINPLVAPPYRALAQASTELGDKPAAISADRTLLRLDPANPAEVHFHLAQLLHQTGDPEARRQLLLALEEAPRNRAALNLLLTMETNPATAADLPASPVSPPSNPSSATP